MTQAQATQGLRDAVKRWRDWKRNSPGYRQIHGQDILACADEIEALLPSLESALGEPQPSEANIRTRIVREILNMDADAESREIELRHCLDAIEKDHQRLERQAAKPEAEGQTGGGK